MLFVKTFGNKNNKTLVFLHGFLGCSQDFYPLVNLLKRTFHCVLIDLPGHGKSPPFFSLTFNNFPFILHHLLQSLSIKTCYFLGYSLGGRLVLHYEEVFPQVAQKIFLLSAHTGLDHIEEKKERFLSDNYWKSLLQKQGLVYFLKKWYQQPIFKDLYPSEEKLEKMILIKKIQHIPSLCYYLEQLSLARQKNYVFYLKNHSNKFILISGENDHKFTSLYQNFHRLNIDHHIVKKASHAPHLQKPHVLKNLITSYY